MDVLIESFDFSGEHRCPFEGRVGVKNGQPIVFTRRLHDSDDHNHTWYVQNYGGLGMEIAGFSEFTFKMFLQEHQYKNWVNYQGTPHDGDRGPIERDLNDMVRFILRVNSTRDEYLGFKINKPVIDNESLHQLVQTNKNMKKFLKAIKTSVELSNQWYADGCQLTQEQLDEMSALFNTEVPSGNEYLRPWDTLPGFRQSWASLVFNKRRKESVEGVIEQVATP